MISILVLPSIFCIYSVQKQNNFGKVNHVKIWKYKRSSYVHDLNHQLAMNRRKKPFVGEDIADTGK